MFFIGDSQPRYDKMNVCDNIIDFSFQKIMLNAYHTALCL